MSKKTEQAEVSDGSPVDPGGGIEAGKRPKGKKRHWLRWSLVVVLVLVLLALLLLGTTGWVLDPLIAPVLRACTPGDLPATPQLDRLRIRLNHRDGLWIEAGGFRLVRRDQREAAAVGSLRLEWTAGQLWHHRHWSPRIVTVQEVEISLRKNADGGWEIIPLPEAETSQPGQPPVNPWEKINGLVGLLLPLEGQPTEFRLGPLVAACKDASDWPVFSIAESCFTIRRIGQTLLLESTGRALIDTHEAHFGLDLTLDQAKRTLAGKWTGRRVDLGWSGAAMRATGLDASIDGLLDATLEWETALDPLQPAWIRYSVGSDGLRVAAPGKLRQPVDISPWQLSLAFDFRSGYGSLEPFELQAGPIRVQAALETETDAATGLQHLRFTGGVDPFSLNEVSDLLDSSLAGPLLDWTGQTGGWQLDQCHLEGWIGLNLEEASHPVARQADWSLAVALLAGKERLALKAEGDWQADPFSFHLAWQVPPFRPAGIPLPAKLAELAAIADFPISAHGATHMAGPTDLRSAMMTIAAGPGTIMPGKPLAGMLALPMNLDGLEAVLTIDDGFRVFGIEELRLGVEGQQVDSGGLQVRLDQPLLSGKVNAWKLEGDFGFSGLTLERLAAPLAGNLQQLIPLERESWNDWGLAEGALHAKLQGVLGKLLEPSLTSGSVGVKTILAAAGMDMPVHLEAQVEPMAETWQASIQAGLDELDVAALVQRWPAGLQPELRAQLVQLEPAGKLGPLKLEAVAEYMEGRAPAEMLKSFLLETRLENVSAHLPELSRIDIAAIEVTATEDQGNMTLAGIAPASFSGQLDARLAWSGPPLAIPSEARLAVTATAGKLERPAWWNKPLPIEAFSLDATLAPAGPAIVDLQLGFAGAGVKLSLRDFRASQQDELWSLAGQLEMSAGDVAMLLDFWPAGIAEEWHTLIRNYRPAGRVEAGSLRFSALVDPAAPGAQGIRDLEFRFDTAGWSFTHENWITVSIPGLLLHGDLDLLRVDLPAVVAGPLQAEAVTLSIAKPLSDDPGTAADWTARVALEDLATLLAASPDAAMREELAPLLEPARGTLDITGSMAMRSKDGTASARIVIAAPALSYGELLRSPNGGRLNSRWDLAMGPDEWRIAADLDGWLLLPFSAFTRTRLNPEAGAPLGGLREMQLTSFAFGKSDLAGRITPSADATTLEIRLAGKRLHFDELLVTMEPMLEDFLSQQPAGASPPVRAATAADQPLAPPADAGLLIDAQLDYGGIQLTPERELRDLRLAARSSGQNLPEFVLTAVEGAGHNMRVSMAGSSAGASAVQVNIPDIAGFANLCVASLGDLNLAKSQLGENLDVIRRVPDSFSGGTLELTGLLEPENSGTLFSGSLKIEDMLMVKAPCLLRLVAGVSGKPFIEGVPFKLFSMEHFSIGKESFTVNNLQLDGPVTMNVFDGYYRFEDQFIRVSGDHYLSNFMLEGPITSPKVWLDNKMTRALGTDDSEWADW